MTAANREYYDEFSKTYEDERHHGYHAMLDRLTLEHAVRYCGDKHVLEVGCGTGLILRDLRPAAATVTGVDLSEGMLRKAKERELRVVQGTAVRLPFEDASFDVVCSYKVLAHVEPIADALSELSRVTRPGGRLLLEFYNRRSLRFLAKRLAGPQSIGDTTHEAAISTRYDTLASVADALPAGLEVEDTAGVRVFTPFAAVHRVPVLRNVFGWLERSARDSFLRSFGGFLVVVLRKSG